MSNTDFWSTEVSQMLRDPERMAKVRRRCEDALRKTTTTQVLKVARILRIKLD